MSDQPETEQPREDSKPETIGELPREEFDRRRGGRNLAIALGLGLFVVMIWVIGFVRLGPALINGPS